MRRHRILRSLVIAVLVGISLLCGALAHNAEAQQGGVRLRLPFDGTRRLTAYVDHMSPNYSYDGNIVVYNGEERPTCADCNQAWTTQGPYCYDGHDGTDYALTCGTAVLAAAAGTVAFVGWDYGFTIKIDHGNGYATWYSHLTVDSNTVNVGSVVASQQQIALSGNSGTTACHLHFGAYHIGNATDAFGWQSNSQDPLAEDAICLWGDGQCSEIVVEDESDRFQKEGNDWNWDCHGNGWTMRWVANKDSTQSAYAAWRPSSQNSGPYAVFAFVPAVHGTTTTAKYTVYDKHGYHDVLVNQNNISDAWVNLGTYDFWGDIVDNVYLWNATGEPDGSTEVCFDTVKFQQFRVYLPLTPNNYP